MRWTAVRCAGFWQSTTRITSFAWLLLPLLFGCAREVSVLPSPATPGSTLRIKNEKADFAKKEDIQVAFGGVVAPVVRIENPTTVVVMVPNVSPGNSKITVRNQRFRGKGEVRIIHPSKRRVFFTMQEGRIELSLAQPYSGSYDIMPTKGRRLSYDVLDEDENLIYSGAIVHPEEATSEIFHDPELGKARRAATPGPAFVGIKIPYIEGRTTIRFFEAADALNLMDVDHRARRRPVHELFVE